MADVDARAAHPGERERLAQEAQDLEVGVDPGGAVDLGADLDRLARRGGPGGTRMQHAAAVAKARHALAVQKMRVDARDLGRDVRAQAHHLSGKLVDHLEGAQLQVVPGAGEQRLDVFEHRRYHQLELVGEEQVQYLAAQLLDARRFRRQDVLDVLGKNPPH